MTLHHYVVTFTDEPGTPALGNWSWSIVAPTREAAIACVRIHFPASVVHACEHQGVINQVVTG